MRSLQPKNNPIELASNYITTSFIGVYLLVVLLGIAQSLIPPNKTRKYCRH